MKHRICASFLLVSICGMALACCPSKKDIDEEIKKQLPIKLPGYKHPSSPKTEFPHRFDPRASFIGSGDEAPVFALTFNSLRSGAAVTTAAKANEDQDCKFTVPKLVPDRLLPTICKKIAEMAVQACVDAVIKNPDWISWCGDPNNPKDVQPIRESCEAVRQPTYDQCEGREPIVVPKGTIPEPFRNMCEPVKAGSSEAESSFGRAEF